MTFDDFVELVSRIPDRISDAHFKSQYAFLYKGNRKIPDYIGKFEQLSHDWTTIADKYGVCSLPLMNKSERESWKKYYTSKRTVELAADRYRKDIEHFDYTEDYDDLLKIIP